MSVGRTRRWCGGVTAAAVLPSALTAALLINASTPVATERLADTRGTATQQAASGAPSTENAAPAGPGAGLDLDFSATSIATLVGAEALLVAVGAGVIVVARRRHQLDEA